MDTAHSQWMEQDTHAHAHTHAHGYLGEVQEE